MSAPSKEREAIEKFLALVEKDEITVFSKEEAAVLQRFAKTLLGFEAFGRAASVFKAILTYLGWLVALYIAIKAGAIEWIKSVAAAR